MKRADTPKNLDEDVLSKIGGVSGITNRASQKAVDGLMVAGDEPRERFLRSRLQFGDQSCLFCVNRECTGDISHGDVRLQVRALHINAID